jgi:hypothetical protein
MHGIHECCAPIKFVPLEANYDIGEVKKIVDVDEDRSGSNLRQFLWRSTPECGTVVWTYLRKFSRS